MSRWEPGARERLVLAAVELFTERGYDSITVPQIAERAGLTKSTFFRHFSSKIDLLAAGQDAMGAWLAEGIAAAPETATVFETLARGLDEVSAHMTNFNRELGPRLHAAIESNAELKARDAMKTIGLASAITDAFMARGLPEAAAQLAGELGVLAFRRGYQRWTEDAPGSELATHTSAALAELKAASAALG
jgi:AcrR family transcriptional regulator